MITEAPNFGIHTGQRIPKGLIPIDLFCVVQGLLSQSSEQHKRTPATLHGMQERLRSEAGGELPEALINQLGFPGLKWQLVYNPRNLPLFFLGAPRNRKALISFSEATGTVVIDRKLDTRNRKVYVDTVRVAGIGQASDYSRRIMALEYSAHGDKPATEVDVSVSHLEFPEPLDPYSFTAQYYFSSSTEAPSKPGITHVYTSGGVTTAAMVAGADAHRLLLRGASSDRTSHLRLLDCSYGSVERLGFRIENTDTVHRVLYDPPIQSIGLSPWRLESPVRLAQS